MLPSARKTHVVPTHLQTPETVLSIGGISLSARQFLLLLVGVALSYDVWKHFEILTMFPVGIVLAVGIAIIPTLVASAFAFGSIARRDLAAWTLAIFRYLIRPKRLIWQSMRFQEPAMREAGESEDTDA